MSIVLANKQMQGNGVESVVHSTSDDELCLHFNVGDVDTATIIYDRPANRLDGGSLADWYKKHKIPGEY